MTRKPVRLDNIRPLPPHIHAETVRDMLYMGTQVGPKDEYERNGDRLPPKDDKP